MRIGHLGSNFRHAAEQPETIAFAHLRHGDLQTGRMPEAFHGGIEARLDQRLWRGRCMHRHRR